jgi:5-methylcytosine-specific restriction endonuclease McrA
MIPASELHKYVSYDPETGIFRSARNSGTKCRIGRVLGSRIKDTGYLCLKFDGKGYRANQVAWAIMTGEWPESRIFHVNGINDDVKWANLSLGPQGVISGIQVLSRKTAHVQGLKEYFTGIPCASGHISTRYTSNQACLACHHRQVRKWQADNREIVRARDLARSRTPESKKRSAENSARWLQKNKDKHVARAHRRRAMKKGAGGSFLPSDIREIFFHQKGRCASCRIKFNASVKQQIDHIVPIAKGGTSNRQNLQLLCQPCNGSKGAKDQIEFMQARGRLL